MQKIYFLFLTLALIACKSNKKTAIHSENQQHNSSQLETSVPVKAEEVAAKEVAFFDVISKDLAPKTPITENLSDFKLMTFQKEEFLAFVNYQKKNGINLILQLPHPVGKFQEFVLVNSSTLSPELQEKFPQLISMKGSAENGDQIRLDVNEKGLFVQVTPIANYENIWLIAPVSDNMYVAYFKKHLTNTRVTE